MDYHAKARPNMNYLENIPSELNNIIGLYLNYNETLVLWDLFNIKINYQYLLSENFPGFYQMFRIVKTNDVKYQEMSYEKAYDIINLAELVVRRIIHGHNSLRTTNIDEISDIIYENQIDTKVLIISDIITSYNIITIGPNLNLGLNKKYKSYIPNIPGIDMDTYFLGACGNYSISYEHNISGDNLLKYIDLTFDYIENNGLDITDLLEVYLIILDNPKYVDIIKDKLSKIVPTNNTLLLYWYIIEYIENIR
jgi:hypothetical protein